MEDKGAEKKVEGVIQAQESGATIFWLRFIGPLSLEREFHDERAVGEIVSVN